MLGLEGSVFQLGFAGVAGWYAPQREEFTMTSALPIALAIALLAQPTTRAKPDFLGSWTMDRNRSESVTTEKVAGPITLAVSQTETTLSIQTMRGDQSEVANYVIEARPDGPTVIGAGTRRAYWDGAKLVTEGAGNVQGQTVSIRATRTLNATGTEMVVETTVAVQHGYTMRGAQTYALVKDVYIRAPR